MKKIIFVVFLAIGLAGIANTGKADSLPEFTIDTVSFTSEKLEFTIRNVGDTYVPGVLVRGQWLNPDRIPVGDFLDLGTHVFPRGLDPVKVVRRDQFLWNENLIPSGARHLKLTLTPSTSVQERDQGNNSAVVDRPFPDLAIDSVALEPTYSYPVVTIKNIGTSKATRYAFTIYYEWRISNQTYSRSYNVNLDLNPGETYIAKAANPSIDLAIGAGTDSVFVTIGRNIAGTYQIAEFDYFNNVKNVDIDLSFPDLVIDSVTFDPTYGYPAVAIKNIGDGKAKHPALMIYYGRFYEVNLDLDPGQTYITKPANPSFDLAPDLAAGSIDLNIGMDIEGRRQIIESDYNNNYKAVDVSFPNLTIDAVTFDPTLGYPIITIKNIGTNTAKHPDFSVRYEYSVSGQTYGNSYNINLDISPGQTYIAKPDNAPAVGPGIKKMILTIGQNIGGADYQIFESDYGNNRKIVDVTFADLAIKSVTFDSSYSYPIVTIENIGVSKAKHPAFRISYKVNSAVHSFEVNLDLDPGQTYAARPVNQNSDLSFLNGAGAGLVIGQDGEGNYQLSELEYKNNKAVLPDFAIDSVIFDSVAKTISITISNIGSVEARFYAEDMFGPTLKLTCHKVGESSAEGYNCEETPLSGGRNSMDPGAKITDKFRLPALWEDVKYVDVSVNLPIKLSEFNLSNNTKNKIPVPLDLTKPALLWPACTAENSQENNFSIAWNWPEDPKASDYQVEIFDATLVNSIYQEWTNNGISFTMPGIVPVNTAFFAHYRSATDRANVSPWSDTALVVCAQSTLTATIEEEATSTEDDSTTAEELPEEIREEIVDELAYPITELGNCQNKDDCKAYCEKPENLEACTNFGVNSGLMTKDEAKTAQKVNEITESSAGPGGCASKESCEAYCEKPENVDVCLDYAEQNNIMSADDLAKAKKVVKILKEGIKTPGDCASPITCKNYCSDSAHAVECVAFGKSAGLLTKEEAEEAEKIAPLMQKGEMPGGGKTREETEAYCENHRDECDKFFEQAGVKKGSATTTIFQKKGSAESAGPGGCKTKAECDAYCDVHPGECDEQVKQAGGEVKEATAPCSTNQDCKVFCQDPANAKACESITIEETPEEAEASKPEVINEEIEKLRQNILEMPSQSQDCVKQKWGAKSFDRVMAGRAPETPVKAEDLQSCYEQGVIKEGEEAAKKPEGQEQRDAEAGNAGGSLLDIVLKWLRKF